MKSLLIRCFVATVALVSCISPALADPTETARIEARDKGVARLVKAIQAGNLGDNYYPWIRCNDHAITGLILLCEGSGWETGQYSEHHRSLVKYIRNNRFNGTGNVGYYMGVWGHAYMIWYVAELASTASAKNRGELDALAVQLIAELSSWQSKESGGWGHHPKLLPTPNGGYAEFSVITSLSLTSLLRAQEKGYNVDPKVIETAFQYLDKTITGSEGAPRYSTGANVAAGNQREGAPRGALVMLPYALDKRTTPAIRRLLAYLKACKDFTGGHASAALGMCHAALLFATIDEYRYFWKLHGSSIIERQNSDGSFTPLPAGERTPEERGGTLSDAFHTLTLSLPDAPWKWGQPGLPAIANGSYDAIAARAKAAVEQGHKAPSMQKLAAMNLKERQGLLTVALTSHLRGLLLETKESKDDAWLPMLMDPSAFCEVVGKSKSGMEIQLVVAPLVVTGLDGDAKLMHKDRQLAQTKFRQDNKKTLIKKLTVRDAADIDLAEVTLQITWTWGGKTFTTTHPLVQAELK